jgi:hypothetical protein
MTRVIVVWKSERSDELNTLAYSGGNGFIRVYEKDNLDARLGELPYADTANEAIKHCFRNPGIKGCIQLRLQEGQKLFDDARFDPEDL